MERGSWNSQCSTTSREACGKHRLLPRPTRSPAHSPSTTGASVLLALWGRPLALREGKEVLLAHTCLVKRSLRGEGAVLFPSPGRCPQVLDIRVWLATLLARASLIPLVVRSFPGWHRPPGCWVILIPRGGWVIGQGRPELPGSLGHGGGAAFHFPGLRIQWLPRGAPVTPRLTLGAKDFHSLPIWEDPRGFPPKPRKPESWRLRNEKANWSAGGNQVRGHGEGNREPGRAYPGAAGAACWLLAVLFGDQCSVLPRLVIFQEKLPIWVLKKVWTIPILKYWQLIFSKKPIGFIFQSWICAVGHWFVTSG